MSGSAPGSAPADEAASDVSPLAAGQPSQHATPKKSYGEILKSSALIGGSAAISMAFGIIRTKVMALLLGPTGIGLIGVYTSISELARGIAGLGIKSSGVRQIAEAVGSGDKKRIALTVST